VVELVDPGVIARLGAASRHILNCGPGNRNERPPFGQSLPSAACGPLSGPLHLRRIELAHVAARQRHIGDTIAVDVEAARPEPRERRLIDLMTTRSWCRPDHITRITENGAQIVPSTGFTPTP